MTQEEALNILKTGANVFLTGQAGSGKTYLLNRYIGYLKKYNIPVAVTASTGIAATHMDGMTIHSWAGIGIKDKMTGEELKALYRKGRVKDRFRRTKALIIDEVSMLHSYRLDLLNLVAQAMRGNEDPFGRLQVIFCGDFFQLPPVTKNSDPADWFAYKSPVWEALNLKICYLETQYRQNDKIYTSVLNDIRHGTVSSETVRKLKTRFQVSMAGQAITRLYTHNIDVDAINNCELSKLPDEERHFFMASRGIPKLVAELKHNCLVPEDLVLKQDAVVIFVRNNFDRGYVNGTLGKIIGFDDYGNPIVKIKNGKEIIAMPESWQLEDRGEIIAEISQTPLRLAWAITVHKSQGMSLDAAEIDLSKSFEPGMGYVALSRIRSLAGLRLMGLNGAALTVHPEISSIDQQFMDLSDKERQRIGGLHFLKLRRMHKDFIKISKTKND